MHVLVTGGTGAVGRFVVAGARAPPATASPLSAAHPGDHPWDLADPAPRLPPADALVHAALAHVPGAYRGGEGDDPARFRRLNLDGTRALFDAAGDARIVFLSSRAVYGDHRRGETLRETDPPAPDSLYGEMKLAAEAALGPPRRRAARHRRLRRPPAQVAGPLRRLPARRAGRPAPRHRGPRRRPRRRRPPRSSTARATGAFNVSDLLLDRHDLLARVQALTGCPHPPPPRADGPPPGVMATDRLRALGWRPGGLPRLDAFLGEVLGRA